MKNTSFLRFLAVLCILAMILSSGASIALASEGMEVSGLSEEAPADEPASEPSGAEVPTATVSPSDVPEESAPAIEDPADTSPTEDPSDVLPADSTPADIPAESPYVPEDAETGTDADTLDASEPLTGWVISDGSKYYYDHNGNAVIGLYEIDENLYLFDNNGVMQTGWQTLTSGGETKRYYFHKTTGAAYTGQQEISSKHYYFKEVIDEDKTDLGVMQTGLVTAADGNVYYLDDNGVAQYGWYTFPNENGGEDTYFFGATYIHALTGLWKLSGNYYYFSEGDDDRGVMQTGFITAPDGNKYYLNETTGVAYTGWKTIDGNKYYFGGTKIHALTGLQKLSGSYYYFGEGDDDRGVMQTGWCVTDDGDIYNLSASGVAQTGWYTAENGNKYYFGATYIHALTGLWTLGSYTYYFNDAGVMQTGWQTIDGNLYYFNESTGRAKTGWITYTTGDGRSVTSYLSTSTGKMLTGLQKINSKYYYFDEDGIMLTGLQEIDGKFYYFQNSGAAKYGWTTVDGNKYYFSYYYIRALTGLQKIDGKYYYFDETGVMQTGLQSIDDKLYYFQDSGAAKYGWTTVDGNKYYFSYYYIRALTGLQKIDGYYYYFGETADNWGVMQTGLVTTASGAKYYLDESSGRAQTGWKTIDGDKYYFGGSKIYALTGVWTLSGSMYFFETDGTLQTGSGIYTSTAGDRYYLTESGKLKTGWITDASGDKYYFGTYTGKMLTGLNKIGSYYYFFHEDTGVMQHSGWYTTSSGIRCCLNTDGTAKTGWISDNDGGKYYLSSALGGLATGLTKIGSSYYFFDEDTGAMQTGLTTAKDGKKYYLSDTGVAQTGWKTIDGDTYYFGATKIYALTGVWTLSGSMYFFETDGTLQTGSGLYTSTAGDRYYLTESGKLKTGWITDASGDKYYFSTSTGKMLTGLNKIGSYYYFFHEDTGVMQTGLITAKNGSKYYLSSSGTAKSGWQTIDGNKYYFGYSTKAALTGLWSIDGYKYYFSPEEDDLGVMQTNYWYKSADTQYYFTSGGTAATGWRTINGDRYYFCPRTCNMFTGWHTISSRTYCFDANGRMLTNTTVDGYKIDGNGYAAISSMKDRMILTAQSYSSKTKYLCVVDTVDCRVGVFTGAKGNWDLLYYWYCTPGASSSPTPTGTFSVYDYCYSFGNEEAGYTCYYGTAFFSTSSSEYLFHSTLYWYGTFNSSNGTLGARLSHGCVRLALSNAKWIYNNIPVGTTVVSY